MSKNTKIIAIVGGVLILVFLIYTGASKGGFSAAFEAMGCGGKKDASKPRMQLSLQDKQFNDCRGLGYVCKRDAKGEVVRPGKGKPCTKFKGADYCNKLWSKRCANAKFKADYKATCAKMAKKADKDDEGDDSGD